MTDREMGLQAMRWYYNEGIKYNISLKNLGFDGFIKFIDAKSKSFISGLGLGLNYIDVGDAEDSLIEMAQNARGKIPNNLGDFTMAVQEGETDFDFNDFINVAKATGSEIIDLAEETGKDIKSGVTGIGKLYKYAPYLIVGGLGLYLYWNKDKVSKGISRLYKDAKKGMKGAFAK